MIHYTDNSIIIEIETPSPLEKLANIQKAIFSSLQNTDGQSNEVIESLAELLENMVFNPQQLFAIQMLITKNGKAEDLAKVLKA